MPTSFIIRAHILICSGISNAAGCTDELVKDGRSIDMLGTEEIDETADEDVCEDIDEKRGVELSALPWGLKLFCARPRTYDRSGLLLRMHQNISRRRRRTGAQRCRHT